MYQLTANPDFIARSNADNTVSYLRVDPANVDYAAYLAWLDQGNTPEPAPVPEPPPQLTAAERLEAAGFSVDELRALLLGKD